MLNIDLKTEYRVLHLVVEYSAEFRPGRLDTELYIQMLNIVLNIDHGIRIWSFTFGV